MYITECKVNHLTNPLGYQMEQVRFSYLIKESAGLSQKAGRIVVALDPEMKQVIADTGMSGDIDFIGTDIAMDLNPCTRYFWQVTAETDQGEKALSEVNWFETAKMDQSWQAAWISCPKKDRHPVFCRDLSAELEKYAECEKAEADLQEVQNRSAADTDTKSAAKKKEIRSARLYICGLGVYEAYLNDKKIGNELLAPGCNDYHKWFQYQTYDITEELKKGGRLEVMCGDGWYLGRFGFYSGLVKEEKAGEYSLIAEVQVTYEDGSRKVIGTDESWKVKRSNIIFSNIYDGEQVDDTLKAAEEETVTITEQKVPLVTRYSLPVTTHKEFGGELIDSTWDETVMDFGQNMSGVFTLRVHQPKGTRIHLQFGEVLQGGHFYRENLRSALAEYIYISDGGEHVLTPHFTFYGFRYVKVSGISNFRPEDLKVQAIYSDVEDAGTFVTGNVKVNRLVENVRWGQRSNFVDVPTDCPQRDERMGWTGDAQVFSATAMFLSDSYAFYRKFLHDMSLEQEEKGGMVPDVVPSFGVGSFSGVWGDACCIIPWNMYQAYGDLTILREQYESMKSWIEFIRKIDGDDHNWRRQFCYGDWVALDSRVRKNDTVMGGTDEAYISDIYYYNSANILAKTAGLLGYTEDAAGYRALADRILNYLRDDYFSKTGRCCLDTQTAQALALEFDIAPNPGMTAAMLKEELLRAEGKLQTGFAGTPFLCKAFCDYGMPEKAYDLLLNEECPGWLYEVNHGATTIWERWNSVEEDGSLSSTGMNSLNHYAYGAVLDWMRQYVGGIRPACPGYRQVKIAPVVDLRLGSASVSYLSQAGQYTCSWKILPKTEGREIEVCFEIPFGCQAGVELPALTDAGRQVLMSYDGIRESEDGSKLLAQPGSYRVTYRAEEPFTRIYTVEDSICELQTRPEVVAVIDRFIPDFAHIDFAYRLRSLRDVVLNRTGDIYRDRQINAAHINTEAQLQEIGEALKKVAILY